MMLDAYQQVLHLPTEIQSKRLAIRQYMLRDAEEFGKLHESALHYHLAPWSPVPATHKTNAEVLNEAREHILLALEKWEDGFDFRFFIVEHSTEVDTPERIIGQIGITSIMRGVAQFANIGYWIGKDFLNKGYATEATVLALRYSFEYLKLHRVSLWISPENSPSLRVAEKLGLRHEGRALRALFLGGRWQDTDIFAITAEEWAVSSDELKRSFL